MDGVGIQKMKNPKKFDAVSNEILWHIWSESIMGDVCVWPGRKYILVFIFDIMTFLKYSGIRQFRVILTLTVWICLVNPLDMPRTHCRASEGKPTMPYHPTITSSSVHDSFHQKISLFLTYYKVSHLNEQYDRKVTWRIILLLLLERHHEWTHPTCNCVFELGGCTSIIDVVHCFYRITMSLNKWELVPKKRR